MTNHEVTSLGRDDGSDGRLPAIDLLESQVELELHLTQMAIGNEVNPQGAPQEAKGQIPNGAAEAGESLGATSKQKWGTTVALVVALVIVSVAIAGIVIIIRTGRLTGVLELIIGAWGATKIYSSGKRKKK